MSRKLIMIAILILSLTVFPKPGFAVDFIIEEVAIDAFLHEDGTISVEETFIYDYTSDFNGIIRTLNHEGDAQITDLAAFEDGVPLDIETEDEFTHYIYREGDNETIVIDITYTLNGALEVYEDRVDFFWGFFDEGNESPYEMMTITVHPPDTDPSAVAIGYDAAEGSESISEEGSVQFDLGYVEDGENGDIRAAFDRDLFPVLETTASGHAGERIEEERQEREEAAATFIERQSLLSDIAFYALPILGLIYTILIVNAWVKNRSRKQAARRHQHADGSIPETTMSMPATIFYTYALHIDSDALSAALLNLVQKGIVHQDTDNTFRLQQSAVSHEHERILVDWLFQDIGDGKQFTFEDMEKFYEDDENETHYHTRFAEWTKAVKKEADAHELNLPSLKFRLGLGLSTILLAVLAIFAIAFELFGVFIASFTIIVVTILFALIHQPRTEEGWQLILDWRSFRKELQELELSEWAGRWNQDQQMTAFIFGLATQVKQVKSLAKELPEKLNTGRPDESDWTGGQLPAFMFTGVLISGGFRSSSAAASNHSSGSSAGPGSIGGGAGGGGGSGGF